MPPACKTRSKIMPDENKEEDVKYIIDPETGEEVVDPGSDDDGEKEDTPADSSTEDKPVADEDSDEDPDKDSDEEPEDEESGDDLSSEEDEPKPVPGESPRERALRREIESLRKKNRVVKRNELLGEDPTPTGEPLPKEKDPQKKDTPSVLDKYDPEQMAGFKEVLNVYADELGFVRKNELHETTYQHAADQTLESFLDIHKEYSPENDRDNVLWNSFLTEFAYYKKPENPRDLAKILERVHNNITGGKVDPASVAANKTKIKQAGHGGTTVPKDNPTSKKVDPAIRGHLKGFTDEEADEFFGDDE